MKVVVAIDSFKGSLSTFESGKAVEEAVKLADPSAEVKIYPIADGGEGTVDAITYALGGELISRDVTGPLGQRVSASYGLISETGLAVMEMSAAAGITLVAPHERDPLKTTTYGVGEMIKDAIQRGCRSFLIGIGGSATNDGGVGMLSALGFEFLGKDGMPIPLGAEGLSDLAAVRADNALPELKECKFTVACDVKNPLCGENGCSAVFGPQKGATAEAVFHMDSWLKNYADLTAAVFGKDLSDREGAGAAGGMGFAFLSYLSGELRSGIETVIDICEIEKHIKDADLVITGEGRLDGQSVMGKAPIGIARVAKKYGKTVIAFSGAVTDDARECNKHGIDAFFPIIRRPCSLEEAMDKQNAYNNLRDTAEQVCLLFFRERKVSKRKPIGFAQ